MRCVMVMADYREPTYLKEYDPDGEGGFGAVSVTTNIADALVFESGTEAIELWRKPSTLIPLRGDGKPNRPLTAFSIEIAPAPPSPEAERPSKKAARTLEPA